MKNLTNRYRRIPVAIIAVLGCCIATAQLPQYQLSRITEQEGLKTADILNITTDKDGFMWLASQGHVQRFDGRHTLFFPFNETVSRVYADSLNRVWVITLRRTYLYINANRGFEEMKFDDSNNNIIQDVFERGGKQLCILKSSGLFCYNQARNIFEKQPAEIQGISKSINGYYAYKGAEYWTTSDTIYQLDPVLKKKITFPFESKFFVLPVSTHELLVSTRKFETWFVDMRTGSKALIQLTGGDNKRIRSDFIIYSGEALNEGKILLGTNKGLLQFNLHDHAINEPVFYYNGQPLQNQQSAKYVFKDASGKIFISHADGIFQMSASGNGIQYFRNYSFAGKSLPDNDVRNFTEDEDGNIWLATINGVAKLNMQSGKLETFSPKDNNTPIELPSIRQVLSDGPYIWIGTSGNGVWLYEKSTRRFIRPKVSAADVAAGRGNNFFNTYIWKIVKLHNGKMFVAGGGRCFLIDTKTLESNQLDFYSSSIVSRSAMQDKEGRVWHGTNQGLYCMDSSFKMLFYTRDTFPDLRVASFCEWKKDKMLVGTKGLYEVTMSGNKLVSFKKKNGVPGVRLIYCMQQDQNGFVWMGTDDGIYRYDPVHDVSLFFDQSDHVQTQAFNSDAAFLSSKGIMFMGGKNGINYFFPPGIQAASNQLNPKVTSFVINGNDSAWLQQQPPYQIAYQNRDIDFIISAPEFKKPFSIRYRYKLHKKDRQWISNDFNDRVRINNLSPGQYDLQVSASLDGIHWFDSQNILQMRVAKPWWHSWWFRLLYLCCIAGAVWLYLRNARKKYVEEEMERAVNYFALSGNRQASTSDIIWDIARNCISRLGFEDCVIYLLDEDRNMLVQKAAYGDKSPRDFEIANPIELPVGEGITGWVAKTGKTLRINDTTKDDRYIVDDNSRLSELAVPVLHEQKVIGVIDSENRRRNFFTKQQQQTLEQIAAICSSKIARSLAEESIQKAELQLQELNAKMLESKFMNLRLQMNPHFLFNILTSIQYLVISGQTSKATEYLNVFASFLRSVLQYAEETVVSLQDEIRVLHMYVALETLSLDESFVYEISVDENVEQEEVMVPFMLLQPFVENAIHHGLVPLVGQKKFCISIQDEEDERLVCTIEDNGVGRIKAAQIKAGKMRAARHESRGVGIVIERLELLGQKSGKFGTVEYKDMFDEAGDPAGTKVIIIIPYYTKTDDYD